MLQAALEYLKHKNSGEVLRIAMYGRKNVAKAMQLEVLHRAVIAAMEQGQSFEHFKKHIKPVLREKEWWGRKDLIDPLTGETVNAQL